MLAQTTHNIAQISNLDLVAAKLIDRFPQSRIFAFYGAMGVGKTTFIKSICAALGSTDTVTSPTYSMVNAYETQQGVDIYHFDFYRTKSIEEIYNIGYEEYFFSGAYCLIEWPEKIESLLQSDCIRVFMEFENENRIIRF
ncbi:MAG TPA: tRNA (adenosine(37)-N6)-threonylcarbamoyltransferase complex ATPase subunit type 1 TsaE [Bacteroidales bacterium]|nr:tRNA (adenosine(37)-N6)-threonylcarbamoyltransferase complex ATPase subunit type 1 TsaE [Bacteroidales bacterium]